MVTKRVLGTFLVTAALFGLVPAQAAMASTTYLGPWSNNLGATSAMTESAYVAWKFTVTSTATITLGTGNVADDPASTPASEIAIYPASGAGTGSWAPMGIISQHSFAPVAGASRYLVYYTGSVTLSPGTYYAAQRYTSTFNGTASGGDGTLSSAWQWGPPISGNYYYYFTTDSGATWNLYNVPYASTITLSDGEPPVLGGGGSAPILQQVPVPASGSCADVQDQSLGWSTSVTGGWGRSWAEWNNGPVCTRTMAYSNGHWHLG